METFFSSGGCYSKSKFLVSVSPFHPASYLAQYSTKHTGQISYPPVTVFCLDMAINGGLMKDVDVFTVAMQGPLFWQEWPRRTALCSWAASSVPWGVIRRNQSKAQVVHPLWKRRLYGPADISYILLIMRFERVCLVCFLDKLDESLCFSHSPL